MQVDFNNLRKQTAYAYNRLVEKLNEGIDCDNELCIKAIDIEEDINELGNYIWGMICCYEENNEDIRNLSDEVELQNFIKQTF